MDPTTALFLANDRIADRVREAQREQLVRIARLGRRPSGETLLERLAGPLGIRPIVRDAPNGLDSLETTG